jgi:hypothetical protein
MLTVACVYKSRAVSKIGGIIGAHYDASWVIKLRNSVARHLTVPHRFVCLTDVEIPEIETIKLVHNWDGWWSKVELFRPGQFDGPVLYFDLDIVMVDNIDHMAGPFRTLCMLEDIVPGMPNSSIMWWDATDPFYLTIYERFSADPGGEAARRQQMHDFGDQGLITGVMRDADRNIAMWQRFLPAEGFVPYSFFSAVNGAIVDGLPKGAKIVYCLGDPKFQWPGALPHVVQHWH